MNFSFESEKELENIFIKCLRAEKVVTDFFREKPQKIFQQLCLSGYGVSDVVSFSSRCVRGDVHIFVNVFEIKNVTPKIEHIMQVSRYHEAIYSQISNCKYTANINNEHIEIHRSKALVYPKRPSDEFIKECSYCDVDILFPYTSWNGIGIDIMFRGHDGDYDVPDSELICPKELEACKRSVAVSMEKAKRYLKNELNKSV